MDNSTLFVVLVSVFLIQAAALAQTWLQNREEIAIRDWAFAGVCLAFGSLFGGMGLYLHHTGASPLTADLVAIAGSAIAGTAWMLVWYGVRHFYRKPTPPYRFVGYFTALFLLVLALKLVLPLTVEWRTTWVSLVVSALSLLTLREFITPQSRRNPIVLLVMTVLLLTSATWLLRGLASLDHEAYVSDYAFTFGLALYDGIVASVTFTVSMIVLTNDRIHGRLHVQANMDPLTGVMNRRAFFDAGRLALATLQRNSHQLAVCLLDIDHFKQINDTYGHAVGDAVLKEFAQLVRRTLREGDLLARYGGEEFALMLHHNDREEAAQALKRLRKVCTEHALVPEAPHYRLTFSAGVCHASGPVTVHLDTLLEAADRALYQAKRAGRDRTVEAPEHYTGTDAAPRCERIA